MEGKWKDANAQLLHHSVHLSKACHSFSYSILRLQRVHAVQYKEWASLTPALIIDAFTYSQSNPRAQATQMENKWNADEYEIAYSGY
jgi:hypothetical protein